jgi:succinyl-diaminopimelate desuccinylase
MNRPYSDPAVLQLARKLIAIRSDSGRAKDLDKALALALAPLAGFTIERFENNGVKSALVYQGRRRPARFKVILNGHLDVIPGKPAQYHPVVQGDQLFGAGAMDMKANLACAIHVFADMAARVPYALGLQLVTDEQTGGFDGTKHQIAQGVTADFVIATEPTNFGIVHKAKGILWLKISARGVTAHGAYPWRGDNAIWKMTAFLNALQCAYPIPREQVWQTTVNLSRIETGNRAVNKIPDDCSVMLDIRFVPEDASRILARIKRLMPPDFAVEVITHEPPLSVSPRNPFVRALQTSARKHAGVQAVLYGAQGSSDARHYTAVGCPGVEFGPVGGGIGTDSEWVSVNSLQTYAAILTDFLASIAV